MSSCELADVVSLSGRWWADCVEKLALEVAALS
jgi:hypothetical protein